MEALSATHCLLPSPRLSVPSSTTHHSLASVAPRAVRALYRLSLLLLAYIRSSRLSLLCWAPCAVRCHPLALSPWFYPVPPDLPHRPARRGCSLSGASCATLVPVFPALASCSPPPSRPFDVISWCVARSPPRVGSILPLSLSCVSCCIRFLAFSLSLLMLQRYCPSADLNDYVLPSSVAGSLIRGVDAPCPTLPRSSSGEPLRLSDLTKFSIPAQLELFGLLRCMDGASSAPSFVAPVARYLSDVPAYRLAHELLCSGISSHSLAALLSPISRTAPLVRRLQHTPPLPLRVVSAFSGAGIDLGAFDALGLPYSLLAYSDSNPSCRAALAALHPEALAFDDAALAALSPFSVDILLAGPPCNLFSGLIREVSDADLDDYFDLLARFLRALDVSAPSVVILENVAALLEPRLTASFHRFCSLVFSYTRYRWSLGLVDCCDFGVPMRRPRLFFVGLRSPA